MDIAASGLKERFSSEGYAPAGFARLAVRLTLAFTAFWTVSILMRTADLFMRFPGRPITADMALVLAGWSGLWAFASMWFTFSLFSLLIAVLVSAFGWRESYPRIASVLVRFGVFSWLLVGTVSIEWQAHFHVSPYSRFGVATMLVAALIVGGVVDSARLGRAARPAIRS